MASDLKTRCATSAGGRDEAYRRKASMIGRGSSSHRRARCSSAGAARAHLSSVVGCVARRRPTNIDSLTMRRIGSDWPPTSVSALRPAATAVCVWVRVKAAESSGTQPRGRRPAGSSPRLLDSAEDADIRCCPALCYGGLEAEIQNACRLIQDRDVLQHACANVLPWGASSALCVLRVPLDHRRRNVHEPGIVGVLAGGIGVAKIKTSGRRLALQTDAAHPSSRLHQKLVPVLIRGARSHDHPEVLPGSWRQFSVPLRGLWPAGRQPSRHPSPSRASAKEEHPVAQGRAMQAAQRSAPSPTAEDGGRPIPPAIRPQFNLSEQTPDGRADQSTPSAGKAV